MTQTMDDVRLVFKTVSEADRILDHPAAVYPTVDDDASIGLICLEVLLQVSSDTPGNPES